MRVKGAATNLRRRALQLFEQIRYFDGGQRRLETLVACFTPARLNACSTVSAVMMSYAMGTPVVIVVLCGSLIRAAV